MNSSAFLHAQDNAYTDNQESDASTSDDKWPFDFFLSAEELYNAVFNNAFHPVFIGSGEGHIVKFNQKFSKLFGYSVDEIAEKESSDLFEIHEYTFRYFIKQRALKGIAKAEITGIKKSGERFPCRISSVMYESDKGEKRSMNTLVNISEHMSARWDIS